MALQEKLSNLEQRATDIKKVLNPYMGITLEEVQKIQGWDSSKKQLQDELWSIGFQIVALKKDLI